MAHQPLRSFDVAFHSPCFRAVGAQLTFGQEMKARVVCAKCGNLLTDWLHSVPSDFVVSWADHENIIRKGMYWIADEDMTGLAGRVVIHLDDRRGMINHPDPLRFQGCCGSSDGRINLLCSCDEEVATEVSDCWTSYYAHFEPVKTVLEFQSES